MLTISPETVVRVLLIFLILLVAFDIGLHIHLWNEFDKLRRKGLWSLAAEAERKGKKND